MFDSLRGDPGFERAMERMRSDVTEMREEVETMLAELEEASQSAR